MEPPHPRLARAVELAIAAAALLVLSPLLLLLTFAVRLDGRGPAMSAQVRLGRRGVPFRMHKFRTLATAAGDTVAPANDPRCTRIGRWLRRWHLDELPQILDVLRGDMALVGPRPEVPANLQDVATADLARLLAVRPGLTGPTQLAFLAEDDVLASQPDPVAIYRRILVPAKVRDDLAWLPSRTIARDLCVLFATPFALGTPRTYARSRQKIGRLLAATPTLGERR